MAISERQFSYRLMAKNIYCYQFPPFFFFLKHFTLKNDNIQALKNDNIQVFKNYNIYTMKNEHPLHLKMITSGPSKMITFAP